MSDCEHCCELKRQLAYVQKMATSLIEEMLDELETPHDLDCPGDDTCECEFVKHINDVLTIINNPGLPQENN
jgi:hypothetical protein